MHWNKTLREQETHPSLPRIPRSAPSFEHESAPKLSETDLVGWLSRLPWGPGQGNCLLRSPFLFAKVSKWVLMMSPSRLFETRYVRVSMASSRRAPYSSRYRHIRINTLAEAWNACFKRGIQVEKEIRSGELRSIRTSRRIPSNVRWWAGKICKVEAIGLFVQADGPK